HRRSPQPRGCSWSGADRRNVFGRRACRAAHRVRCAENRLRPRAACRIQAGCAESGELGRAKGADAMKASTLLSGLLTVALWRVRDGLSVNAGFRLAHEAE